MIQAKDGSMFDRALVHPDRNNFGPRLGFAYSATSTMVVRGGWGMSYVHVNRIGSANLLAINGPQVVRAVVNQTDPTSPSFRTTEQGYPAGVTDPSQFNPATALVSYIDPNFHSSPVQSWFASVQQQFGPRFLLDIAYVGNKADDLLYLANYNQAAVNNAGRQPHACGTAADPDVRRHHVRLQRRKVTVQGVPGQGRMAREGSHAAHVAHAVGRAGQRRRRPREPERQLPGSAGFPQHRRGLRAVRYDQPYNSTTSFVWTLPFGHGRRWGSEWPVALDALAGGWQLSGIQTFTPGEMVTLTYSPAGAFQVSGITNDFSGANNYRPNVTCDPYAPAGQQTINNWFNTACVPAPTDPSQPFGNAGRNSVRGPNFSQFDMAAIKQVSLGKTARLELRVEAFNLFNRTNFGPPVGNRSAGNFGTYHDGLRRAPDAVGGEVRMVANTCGRSPRRSRRACSSGGPCSRTRQRPYSSSAIVARAAIVPSTPSRATRSRSRWVRM